MIENVDVEKLPADIKGYCTDSIMRSPGVILATIKVDNVRGDNIVIRIVLDNAQLVDVIIGRTYTKLPRAGYCKVDNYLHFQHRDDLDPFQMKIINTVKPLQLMRRYSALFSKVCKCELKWYQGLHTCVEHETTEGENTNDRIEKKDINVEDVSG